MENFQLEIPKEWMLWRVYNQHMVDCDSCGNWRCKDQCEFGSRTLRVVLNQDGFVEYYELHDPMDHPRFDESTAFPSVKPNIDIFGPPQCRSRRQRGWYQVKTWPPRSPHLRSFGHVKPFSWATLPQELFRDILSNTCKDKHELGRMRQVNKYWAAQCSSDIFRGLLMSSRLDVLDLCNFIKDPACLFLPHLLDITIRLSASVPDHPYIHPLPQIWVRNYMALELRGPLPSSIRTLRSIHALLPKSLPSSFHVTSRFFACPTSTFVVSMIWCI